MFVVSVIWDKRAWSVYWQFMEHTGSSNLATQQALLRPVLRLLKGYEIVLRGQSIKSKGQQKYIGRLKELKRVARRHSNFWIGLYGQMWIAALESQSDWVRNLMMIRSNKRSFFQRGLRAMALIQADF